MIELANVMPISSLRNNLSAIEEIVNGKKEPVLLTKNGRSNTVMVDAEVWANIEAQLEDKDLQAICV